MDATLRTMNIDVRVEGGPPYDFIPIINEKAPVKGYTIDEKTLLQLIQISNLWIYEAGTNKIISGKNYYDYFPQEGGGGGGGGGDAYTKKQTDTLLNAKVDKKSGYGLSQENFTSALKTKLNGLENYDDTAIKNDISSLQNTSHTHTNKSILDTITKDSFMTSEEKAKLSSLENYDDTELRGKISTLETDSHNHSNKNILDDIKADSLVTIEDRLNMDAIPGIRSDLNTIESKVDELQLYKFPNATIIGSPTINNGQISNFSAVNYMKFPFIVNMQGRPFTIMIEFTTASDITNQQNIIDGIDHGIAFAVRSGKFILDMGSRTGEWDITNGEKISSVTVTANTTYRVKISWDGSVYKFEYSTDGETYTEDTAMTVTSTASLYPTQINIGVTSRLEGVFKGSINMNHCSLTISDKVVWTGMDDVGLATRMAVDMSNIDDAGVNIIKNIINTEAYTRNETDTLLNTKVDKDGDKVLSDNNFSDDEKLKLESLENYDDSNIKNEIATIVNSGVKNLLPSNAKTISDKGLTAVVDGNGIVTISGETSSVSNFELDFPVPTSIKGKKVILTGCPAGGANAGTYRLLVRSLDDPKTNIASDIGNGATFTLPSEFERIVVRINVFAGYVVDNLVFKPMLRDASIEDDTFVPYAPTNRDLYEMIVKHSVTESTVANVVLKNNDTTVITGTPTNINVTLPQPVQGNEYICGCNFIAGSNVSFSDAVEGSCIIKWSKEPTWTTGKLYEIIYRCLWLKNSDGKIIINAVCNEVTL